MTFILGMATPALGLLCADTRLNIKTAEGQRHGVDTGSFDVVLGDGSTVHVPAVRRKLHRFEWGWAAASGSSHLLNAAIFEHLSDLNISHPSEIGPQVVEVVDQKGDDLRAEFSNPAPEDRVGLLYLFEAKGRFEVGQCVVGLDYDPPAKADYVTSFPSDVGQAFVERTNASIGQALFAPTDANDLWKLARCVADIVHRVHKESASVSDLIDLILLVRQGPSNIVTLAAHAESRRMRAASSDWISNEFSPLQ